MAIENLSLADRLQRDSHRICSLILNSDLEWIDIAIEINMMRELCEFEAPEKLELFEAVYVSRFMRLWEQWRAPTQQDEHEWSASEKNWSPPSSGFEPDEGGGGGLTPA